MTSWQKNIPYCWLHISVCFHAFPKFIIVGFGPLMFLLNPISPPKYRALAKYTTKQWLYPNTKYLNSESATQTQISPTQIIGNPACHMHRLPRKESVSVSCRSTAPMRSSSLSVAQRYGKFCSRVAG